MAQSVIGALRVNLGLDSAQFERGAKKAQTTTQRLGSSLQKFGAAMSLVSAGIVAAFRAQINAADEAGKAAQKVGLSVEALTRLRFAADLSGVSAQQLETGIQRLSRTMVSGSKAFDRVGIAARDAAGRIRPTEDVLLDLADVFQSMPDGAEKTALAIETLGRSGADLIPLLNGGSDALRAMMGEADALGLTISTKTFRAAERFNDALTRVGAATTGVARQIAADFAPVMAEIAERIARVAAAFADMSPRVRLALTALVGYTAVVGPAALAVGTLVRAFASLRVVLLALSGPAGLIALAAGALGAVVVSASLAEEKTDTLSAAMRGTVEAASVLGTELGILSGNDLPAATRGTVALANANLTLARSAFAAAEAELAKAKAIAESLQLQVGVESAFLPGVEPPSEAAYREALERTGRAAEALRKAQQELEASVFSGRKVTEEATQAVEGFADQLERTTASAGGAGRAVREVADASIELAEGFNPLETAVGGVADAFGDFLAQGLTDFQSFKQSILGTFRGLLSEMVSTALRNRINIGIGAGPGGGLLGGLGGALGPIALGIGAIGGLLGARRRRRQRAAAEREAAAQERGGLEVELLRATGDTAELRRRELDALRPANRALAERLFALQDEQRIGAERATLEGQLLQLQGDIAELRRREIAALDPANRSLAERVFLMQDEVRIGDERRGLEERLLRLQGDTEELRRREIEALDETNRGLLRQIFALEDMAETMDRIRSRLSGTFDLSRIEFGSSFEQRLSQVAEARGYESIAGVPARNLLPGNDPQLSNMENLLKRSSDTLDAILFNGIPVRA